eukprot:TRINITY_DN600_c0_g1_i1.p1 TRINITY_DN600_c0_g1~~TRINITY_DN600_c0_g1_i1.p1  ORF type:complete len:391 (-),score=113.38 TRINITY_DN600_c0_g1_i1:62-1234(-)
MSRPVVGTYAQGKITKATTTLPHVFLTPIRDDVVRDVHTRMAKNHRQPYAVSKVAGEQTSAISWGTGRAVARIPRVSGGGTHRSGQGAFGNMCRKGRMFAPNKVWRRWHRRINVEEKRFAMASAIAATAIPALVMARGHRISQVPEIPLVIDTNSVSTLSKTKAAVELLKEVKAYEDVEKVRDNVTQRAGQGKARNRRWRRRVGPLVVYAKAGSHTRALRNVAGVELCPVTRLNLLRLAPGGHLGRFVIWTKDAFESLDKVYGTRRLGSGSKKGYVLPRPQLTNPDIFRVIRSEEVQGVLRAKRDTFVRKYTRKNPLNNKARMAALNPHSVQRRRQGYLANAASLKKKTELQAAIQKGPAPAAVKAARKAKRVASARHRKEAAAYYKNVE